MYRSCTGWLVVEPKERPTFLSAWKTSIPKVKRVKSASIDKQIFELHKHIKHLQDQSFVYQVLSKLNQASGTGISPSELN